MRVCGIYEGKDGFYISRWIKGLKGSRLLEEKKSEKPDLKHGEVAVIALPARMVFLKVMEFPFGEPGKIRGALPFEMAEELAGDPSEYKLSFYYLYKGKRKARVMGGAVKRDILFKEVEKLKLKKMEATSSSVAFLNTLLEKEEVREDTLYCLKGENEGIIVSARGKEILFERSVQSSRLKEEAELAKRLLGEKIKEIRFFDDPMMIARGAALGVIDPERYARLNLLEERGSWEKLIEEHGREIKRILIASLILLVAWGAGWFINYKNVIAEKEKLEREITSIYRRYFGEGKIVVPLKQARRKIEELEKEIKAKSAEGTRPLLILEKVSGSIPASLNVRLDNIHIRGEEVELEGSAESFEDIDRLKKALEKSFKSVEINYARVSADGKSVSFGIKLKEMI